MSTIELKNVSKIFDDKTVVNDVSLSVSNGEFLALVGPSGCGKSTILRMISGLETIDKGEIIIDGKVINEVSPKNRDIAMVFQNYALYPHMTVSENLGFGLKMKGQSKEEIEEAVSTVANLLDITELLERRPKQLSGGQKQRIAVGRAIVRNPKAFLFDEPLSNLDAKLRVKMRADLLRLHKEQKATSIYVTHDQVEAMTMADRIAIINKGVVQQIDTPLNVYNHPANLFVATFIGSPSMNFITGIISNSTSSPVFKSEIGSVELSLPVSALKGISLKPDQKVTLGIRPEDLRLKSTGQSIPFAPTDVELVEHMGDVSLLHISPEPGLEWTLKVKPTEEIEINDTIQPHFDSDAIHLFDHESGINLFES